MKTGLSALLMVLTAALLNGASPDVLHEVPIVNPGFEDPLVDDGTYTVNDVPGWTGVISWFHTANPDDTWFPGTSEGSALPNPIGGDNVAGINTTTRLFQDLSSVLEPDTTYTLSMLVGHRLNVPFGDPVVQLSANGFVVAEGNPEAPPGGEFMPFEMSYTTPASSTLFDSDMRIEIWSQGQDAQLWIDDVRLTAVPVPEPSVLGLGLACLAGLVCARRRKRAE